VTAIYDFHVSNAELSFDVKINCFYVLRKMTKIMNHITKIIHVFIAKHYGVFVECMTYAIKIHIKHLIKLILPYGFIAKIQNKHSLQVSTIERPQDIYTSDGRKVCVIYLQDRINLHAPYLYKPNLIFWDRYNYSLDVHFYTHLDFLNTKGKPQRKYIWFFESEGIVPWHYYALIKNYSIASDFTEIYTHSEKILNKFHNAHFGPGCATVTLKRLPPPPIPSLPIRRHCKF
jgi:hypothetical protein